MKFSLVSKISIS